jgi:hypothetical protein
LAASGGREKGWTALFPRALPWANIENPFGVKNTPKNFPDNALPVTPTAKGMINFFKMFYVESRFAKDNFTKYGIKLYLIFLDRLYITVQCWIVKKSKKVAE